MNDRMYVDGAIVCYGRFCNILFLRKDGGLLFNISRFSVH